MIIPCMNFTSNGEAGGNVALVEDGSVRVGWPGAPGWTTTGVGGSACCAETGSDNKHARAPAARSPLCHTASLTTDRSLSLALKRKDFISVESSSLEDFNLPQNAPKDRQKPILPQRNQTQK
jgi:hypothetical protein